MSEIVLFHHVCGLTPGVQDLAEAVRAAGHQVHTPDLFEGRTFDSLEAGMAHLDGVGFDEVAGRGVRAAADLPGELVVAGISLGVVPAQQVAQTRPGVRGAVLLEACVPPAALGGTWPVALPVQVHGMDADPFFALEGDVDAAAALVTGADDGELFLYPGDQHLFSDSSLASYDDAATVLLLERLLAFLARV